MFILPLQPAVMWLGLIPEAGECSARWRGLVWLQMMFLTHPLFGGSVDLDERKSPSVSAVLSPEQYIATHWCLLTRYKNRVHDPIPFSLCFGTQLPTCKPACHKGCCVTTIIPPYWATKSDNKARTPAAIKHISTNLTSILQVKNAIASLVIVPHLDVNRAVYTHVFDTATDFCTIMASSWHLISQIMCPSISRLVAQDGQEKEQHNFHFLKLLHIHLWESGVGSSRSVCGNERRWYCTDSHCWTA